MDELQEELTEAQNKMADLQMAASAAPMLDKATDDISELRAKVRVNSTQCVEQPLFPKQNVNAL